MAPCHVIVGLRFLQSYIPGFFTFSTSRLPLSEVSFVCNRLHNWLPARHQYRVQVEKSPIDIPDIAPHLAHRVSVMPKQNSQLLANRHVPSAWQQIHQ